MITMYDLHGERPAERGAVPVKIGFVSYDLNDGKINHKGTITCSNPEECDFEHVGIHGPFFNTLGSFVLEHLPSGQETWVQSPVKDLRSLVSDARDQIRIMP